MKTEKIIRMFVDAINEHDLSKMERLITFDHCFIDSLDRRNEGTDSVLKIWRDYFDMTPDYHIDVENILQDGAIHAVFGQAHGTYKKAQDSNIDGYWEIPAAWRVIVEDGKIQQLQVYADNEPVRQLLYKIGALD